MSLPEISFDIASATSDNYIITTETEAYSDDKSYIPTQV